MKVESAYKIASGGEEPSAETVLSINRAAKEINMDDPVGLVLMTIMRAHSDKIDSIPNRIKQATNELESSAQSKVNAVIAQAVAAAVPELTKVVVASAERVAGDKAKTDKTKWYIAALITSITVLGAAVAGGYFCATGQMKSASATGFDEGFKKGWMASKNIEAWTQTKTGVLALHMLENGSLESIVRCDQKTWSVMTDSAKKKWCITNGKAGIGWMLQPGYDEK